MQAMIFAAGLGTRLKPLTDSRPKALVTIGDKTLLERNIEKIDSYGIKNIVVNIYHFPDMMTEFIDNIRQKYNCNIVISDEREHLLNTGGGFLFAKDLFFNNFSLSNSLNNKLLDTTKKNSVISEVFSLKMTEICEKISKIIKKIFSTDDSDSRLRKNVFDNDEDDLILLHNVDILSDIDFAEMQKAFIESSPLALLAVKKRETQRYFIFNEKDELSGWVNVATNQKIITRKCKKENLYAFSGVHIVRKDIFDFITQSGAFSITDMYLELSKKHIIKPFIHEGKWLDVGKIDAIKKAEEMF